MLMKQRLPHGWIGVHDHLRSPEPLRPAPRRPQVRLLLPRARAHPGPARDGAGRRTRLRAAGGRGHVRGSRRGGEEAAAARARRRRDAQVRAHRAARERGRRRHGRRARRRRRRAEEEGELQPRPFVGAGRRRRRRRQEGAAGEAAQGAWGGGAVRRDASGAARARALHAARAVVRGHRGRAPRDGRDALQPRPLQGAVRRRAGGGGAAALCSPLPASHRHRPLHLRRPP